ncbi:mucin-3A-like [Drosophila subobscura]|uniref:mucin-3A-like n=1 Tax=Drosophila subobscura TaxID=7241 RepID=UPI00155AB87B|nr:mucin-3A-like [Drosophila subobscura]
MSEPFGESTEIPDLDSVFETQSTIQSTESSINEPSTIYSSESTYGSPLDTDTMSESFGESTKYRDHESILTAQPTGQLTESTALDRSSRHESLSTNLLKAHSTGRGPATFQFNYSPIISEPLKSEIQPTEKLDQKTTSTIPTLLTQTKPPASTFSDAQSITKTLAKSTERTVDASKKQAEGTNPLSKLTGKSTAGTPTISKPQEKESEAHDLTSIFTSQTIPSKTLTSAPSRSPSKGETSTKFTELSVLKSTKKIEGSTQELTGKGTAGTPTKLKHLEKESESHDLISISTMKAPSKPHTSIPSGSTPSSKTSVKTTESPVLKSTWSRKSTISLSKSPGKASMGTPKNSEPKFESSEIRPLTFDSLTQLAIHSTISGLTSDTPSMAETSAKSIESPVRQSTLDTETTVSRSETSGISTADADEISERFEKSKEYPDRAFGLETQATVQLTGDLERNPTDTLSMFDASTINSLDHSRISPAGTGILSEPFGESTDSPGRDSVFETPPTIQLAVYPASNHSETSSLYKPSTIYSLEYSGIYPTVASSEGFQETKESPDRASVFKTEPTIQLTVHPTSKSSDKMPMYEPEYSLDYSGISRADADAISEPFGESTDSPYRASAKPAIKLTVYPGSNPSATPSIYRPSTEYSLDYSDISPADADATSEPFEEFTESPDRAFVLETQATVQLTGYAESNPSDTLSIFDASPINSLDHSGLSSADADAVSKPFWESTESPDLASVFKIQSTIKLTVYPSIYKPSTEYSLDYSGIPPADADAISEPRKEESKESPDRASALETPPTIELTGYPERKPSDTPSNYKPSTIYSLDYSDISPTVAISEGFMETKESPDRASISKTEPTMQLTVHPTTNSSDTVSIYEPSMEYLLDYTGISPADPGAISEPFEEFTESPDRASVLETQPTIKITGYPEINPPFTPSVYKPSTETSLDYSGVSPADLDADALAKPFEPFTNSSDRDFVLDTQPTIHPTSNSSDKLSMDEPSMINSLDYSPADADSISEILLDSAESPNREPMVQSKKYTDIVEITNRLFVIDDLLIADTTKSGFLTTRSNIYLSTSEEKRTKPVSSFTTIAHPKDGESGQPASEDGEPGPPPEDAKSGEPSPGSEKTGGQPPGLFTSIKPLEDGQSGESLPEDGQSGGPGGATPEDGQSGGQPPGLFTSIKPPEDGQSGESQPEDGQSGEPLPEDGQSGGRGGATPEDGQLWGQPPGLYTSIKPSQDGQSGESQPEDGQSGESQPEDGQSGEPLPEDGQSGGPGGATPEDGQMDNLENHNQKMDNLENHNQKMDNLVDVVEQHQRMDSLGDNHQGYSLRSNH